MYYQGRKVLVTGADGFIGSHLVEMLVREGAHVTALTLYNSFNNWGWLEDVDLSRNIKVVCGDIRDPHFCRSIVQEVDTVFHLAALIAIPYSYVAPDSYVSTNVQGSLNLVQAARDNGVARFIHTSTSEVYGTARYVPINEEHPLQPQSPYSASKIGADAMVMSYYLSFGTPVTVVRPFNAYGPRQSARAVIPTIITQLLSGQECLRLGSLHPTRDFNYVEDTCRGFLELAACPEAVGQTVNVGSNYEISVGDTVAMIQEILGTDARVDTDDQRLRPSRSEVERLWCDNSRISSLTGFRPRVGIREGLARTIEWLRQPHNLSKYKAHIYNV